MNKKIKASNNENLYYHTRKRIKSTAIPNTQLSEENSYFWKLIRSEESVSDEIIFQATSASRMGVDMLDSGDSSSSVASGLVLAANLSADENCNDNSNLEISKSCHHDKNPRSTQENPNDNALQSSFCNETSKVKTAHAPMGTVYRICNNYANDVCIDDSKKLAQRSVDPDKYLLTKNKKIANLGDGVNLNNNLNAIVSTASNCAFKSVRSPLSTVSCNNYIGSDGKLSQNFQNITSSYANVNQNSPSQNLARSSSPSMPSTSQQAAIMKNYHQQQLRTLHPQKQHAQVLAKSQPLFLVPDENFFLYRNQSTCSLTFGDRDHFTTLSDEIILQIFRWLPKKTLIRCSRVCRRFNRCAKDESLWTRLDLGGRSLRAGAIENVLTRGVVILRLAQTELSQPVFNSNFFINESDFVTKLQYLDLSMISITKESLKMLLSKCRELKKLSLEHVPLNDDVCTEIAKNGNLEALNLAMCLGLEAWSVRKLMESLKNLNSLNISWTNLTVDAVTSLVTNITPNIMRLNLAGCRTTMFDSHLNSLAKRCPQLLELDLSDCTGLTSNAIGIVCKFKMLEYLSLSRCYQIPASSYMNLTNLRTLTYLDVFGILSDTTLEMLEHNFPALGINKFIHSSVARPTVGTRRTSIWGLRTRD